MISLPTALLWVKRCLTKYRLPEPMRRAHLVANEARFFKLKKIRMEFNYLILYHNYNIMIEALGSTHLCKLRFENREPLSWREKVLEVATDWLDLSGRIAQVSGDQNLGNRQLVVDLEREEPSFPGQTFCKVIFFYGTVILPLLALIAYWIASSNHSFQLRAITAPQLTILGVSQQKRLIDAIRENDAATALLLIQAMSGEELSQSMGYNESLQTPLRWAMNYNREGIALALIEKLSPDQLSVRHNDGYTALITAITYHDRFKAAPLALIKKLNGQQLSVQDSWGTTAFMLAVRDSDLTEVALSLLEKLNPEQLSLQDNQGETALMNCYNPDILEDLITKLDPVQLSLRSHLGRTVLTSATFKNHLLKVRALLKKIPPDQNRQELLEALLLAIEKNRLLISEALIEKIPSKYLEAPLAQALQKKRLRIAKMLQKKIARGLFAMGCSAPQDGTPLHRSFQANRLCEPRLAQIVAQFI